MNKSAQSPSVRIPERSPQEPPGQRLSQSDVAVRIRPLASAGAPDGPVVLEIRPGQGKSSDWIQHWIAHSREAISELLHERKALLFRGLGIASVDDFQTVLASLGTELLEYSERSTPRKQVDGKVYTSTEYPKTQEIPMHNENSYSRKWPRKILFCCLQPAAEGGATPIADSRAVYHAIGERTRRLFEDKKVMYVRNYGQGVDLSWQDSFQTDDPAMVESYCRSSGITFDWFDNGNCLRTVQVLPAVQRFRPTGERVWFNQAHLFHPSSLAPALRQSLAALFPVERLPRNACYGDGTPFDEAVMEEIREAYRKTRVTFEWEKGDVLLLDNLFYAHGRLPFAGDRKVVVAMDSLGGSDVEAV